MYEAGESRRSGGQEERRRRRRSNRRNKGNPNHQEEQVFQEGIKQTNENIFHVPRIPDSDVGL